MIILNGQTTSIRDEMKKFEAEFEADKSMAVKRYTARQRAMIRELLPRNPTASVYRLMIASELRWFKEELWKSAVWERRQHYIDCAKEFIQNARRMEVIYDETRDVLYDYLYKLAREAEKRRGVK